MSYLLDGSEIRRPTSIREENSTQLAQHRTLDGSIKRDYFGDNKREWVLEYDIVKKSDYDTIKTIYDSHLSTGATKTWEITETNYTIASTNVHIDMRIRDFSIKGTDYLSSFTLILTES